MNPQRLTLVFPVGSPLHDHPEAVAWLRDVNRILAEQGVDEQVQKHLETFMAQGQGVVTP